MPLRTRKFELFAIALAIALLGFVEYLGQRSTTELVETARRVQHSQEVITHLDALMIAQLDSESSRRAYALTNDESQLGPYRGATQRAFAEIDQLQALLADNPDQRARLDRLTPLVRERLESLDRAVTNQQKRGGIDPTREVQGTQNGSRRMEAVRTVAAEMNAVEQELRAQRERTTQASLRQARIIQLLGTVVSVLIFVYVLNRVRLESRRRRESERRARDNEEDLQTTLDSIGDGVIATDAEGLVRRMNPVAERLTGWTIGDALGKPCHEVFKLVNEVNDKAVTDPITKALENGAVVEIDDAAVLVSKDGSKRRVADSAAPIRGSRGDVRGAVLVFRDITRVLDDARALRRVHTFLDSVIENLPNMIFVKDANDLAFVRLNRAGEKLLGKSREDLIGQTDFAFFPPDQARAFTAKDRETLRGKKVLDISEEPIETETGTRWLHTQKVPLLDEHGEPEYLVGISEDITERRRADVLLRASMDATEVAHRELESFSYSVAHDLRAPLRSIDGFSQALLDDYSAVLDAQGKDYLARVRNNARRMSELIDDLLALSRVSQQELRRSDVDISAIASDAATEMKKHWNPNAAVIVPKGLRVFADVRLVRVLLDNLLSNALKFSSKLEDAARVELGHQRENGEDVFFVKDNGAGFDQASAKNLYVAFQRYHRPSEYEGSGIGLATAERIVTRHGGRIWAESQVDHGAQFFFVLERARG